MSCRRLVAGLGALLAGLALAAPSGASAAGWTPEAASYGVGQTDNVAIPMRDGIDLSADVFYPTTSNGREAVGPFPVLVSETPYDKQATIAGTAASAFTGYDPYLIERGYIQVIVDVRGTGDSGGTFELFGPQEAADSVQVIDWAAKLSNSTGKVGMTGESYLGIDQLFAAAAIGPRSPLKAIFPITASDDVYRELVTSGGLFNIETDGALGGAYGGLAMLAPLAQPSGALATLLEQHAGAITGFTAGLFSNVLTNGDDAYDESFWQARDPVNVLAQIVKNGIPAYSVNGLWDVYQEGAPLNYAAFQNAYDGRPVGAPMAPGQAVTPRYQLLIKNEYHGDIESAGLDVDPIKLAWFDHWLKGENTGILDTTTPLHVVEVAGQQMSTADYPVASAVPTPFYLGSGGTLTSSAPSVVSGSDTLVWTGATLPCDRSTEQWALGGGQLVLDSLGITDPCTTDTVPSMVGPGELTYTTAPFSKSTLLAGPIDATLYATANTKDTEWVAELSLEKPNGTETDLTQGALLGSDRAVVAANSWAGPDGRLFYPYHPFTRAAIEPVVPGAVTRYDIDIRPTFATLAAGDRLVLRILSSQTPHLIPIPAQIVNLVGGVYSVQRRAGAASYLELPLDSAAG